MYGLMYLDKQTRTEHRHTEVVRIDVKMCRRYVKSQLLEMTFSLSSVDILRSIHYITKQNKGFTDILTNVNAWHIQDGNKAWHMLKHNLRHNPSPKLNLFLRTTNIDQTKWQLLATLIAKVDYFNVLAKAYETPLLRKWWQQGFPKSPCDHLPDKH